MRVRETERDKVCLITIAWRMVSGLQVHRKVDHYARSELVLCENRQINGNF